MEAMVYRTRQKVISLLLYYVIFLNTRFFFLFFVLFIRFLPFSLMIHKTQRWKITWRNPLKMYRIQYIPKKERTPPQHLSKLVNKNKLLNLNVAFYFLNILASLDVLTWSTTGGPINKPIKHLDLTRHHQNTV